MSNGNGQKDTVYIDVDDEITAVIDKLRGSPHRIVALVLPKRAAVFQSIVNMKLLKRTADESKKHVVLITSESALLPLAGAVGLHVAHSLQSKPEIPPGPDEQRSQEKVTEGEAPLDPNAPIGQLAGQSDESIEVGDKPNGNIATAGAGKAKKAKKDKSGGDKSKIKVPNFEKFRKRFIIGGIAAVLLLVAGVLGLVVLPKSTITLKTDTSNIDTDVTFTADTTARLFDQENKILPAISKEFRRTDTERVAATGEIDKGNKASGTLGLTNCSGSTGEVTIPAGTSLTTGGLTFVTNNSVTLPESSFNSSNTCKTDARSVPVTAEKPGTQYNVDSGKDFVVSGFSGVRGRNANPMHGGTSDIVRVISQDDIEKGKQAIQNRANGDAPDELQEDIRNDGYYPIEESLHAGEPTVTTDRNANDEADSVTVTSTTTYTMVGVKEADLKKIIETDVEDNIDRSKQTIQNNGLSKATFRVENTQESQTTFGLQTQVVVGPNVDSDGLKEQILGKSRTETERILRDWPDISDVEIKYSPFWVNSTPKSANKITIIFEDARK